MSRPESKAWLIAAMLLLVVAPLGAQETPAAPPPEGQAAPPAGPPPPPTELVFEREVFSYPAYQRRNPFRPLVGALAGGPRFEQIRLRGIIWSAEPGRSVALFGIGDTGPGGAAAPAAAPVPGVAPAETSKRLRVGDSWGNTRVIEIQRDQVVVQVEDFGLTERKVLGLTRRSAGGGQ